MAAPYRYAAVFMCLSNSEPTCRAVLHMRMPWCRTLCANAPRCLIYNSLEQGSNIWSDSAPNCVSALCEPVQFGSCFPVANCAIECAPGSSIDCMMSHFVPFLITSKSFSVSSYFSRRELSGINLLSVKPQPHEGTHVASSPSGRHRTKHLHLAIAAPSSPRAPVNALPTSA